MAEYILGYESNQIIRKTIGSPAVNFEFSDRSHSILIDNSIGSPSNGLYFCFDSIATAGSTSGYVQGGASIELDVRVGSISIMGSGGSTQQIQVIRLT